MSMPLMRQRLMLSLGRTSSPHVGLWLARGWKSFIKGEGDEQQNGKAGHLDVACNQKPSRLYAQAYQRWQEATADPAHFRLLYARLDHRLFIGLTAASAIETGVCTSHSYGMPMIPGSSAKGAARAYAGAIGVPPDYLATLFGEDEDSAKAGKRTASAGALVWHDAWWIPEMGVLPFVREVVTVHHQQYYAGTGEATDFDSPVPNAQIAVQGSFYFVVEGDPAWAQLALDLLQNALAETGIGAKRAAGYGFMTIDRQAMSKAEAERRKSMEKTQGPEEKVRFRLEGMDEKQLAEKFGTGVNGTKADYSGEEWARVPAIGLELHGTWIRSWASETRKTNKAKARAYKFFMGLKVED
ncbi:type III-B CRISPR module RAMP protein Cmr6 [Propionivibrio sp.]|uniref:type III-B CRISPR module RAMP protein Cmr6 n=1 Tax=Propionivibrio sp. TaxID=2212460 RepID=UPI003BEF97A5